MSDTPDLTPERIWAWETWNREGQKSGQWCNYTKNGNEYVRADLHEAERARADRAEAEARYWRGEIDTVLAGREDEYDRAEKAEAERDALAEKLAKAVSVLHCIVEEDQIDVLGVDETRDGHFAKIARATIAEITGGGND